jgi:sulfofructose kinase
MGRSPRVARIVSLGYACLDHRFWVERFPPVSGRTLVHAYRADLGGPAGVAAVTAVRMGGAAVFLGRRGDDEAGTRVEASLRAEGVDTHAFRAFPGARTPVSGVLIAPGGERHIFAHRGEGLPEDPDWLPLDTLRTAGAVLLDARWPRGAVRVAEAARRLTLPVVLDLDLETSDAWHLAGLATHVIADQELARSRGGVVSTLGQLRALGAWAAVTLGSDGVAWQGGRLPAFGVQVRDTTGAGDVFHGAFALALAEGETEEQALRFALAAAAQRCALAEVPRRDDVARLLHQGGA